jgi:hypothetical protein
MPTRSVRLAIVAPKNERREGRFSLLIRLDLPEEDFWPGIISLWPVPRRKSSTILTEQTKAVYISHFVALQPKDTFRRHETATTVWPSSTTPCATSCAAKGPAALPVAASSTMPTVGLKKRVCATDLGRSESRVYR